MKIRSMTQSSVMLLVAGVTCVMALTGCAAPDGSGQAWSTKGQSSIGSVASGVTLSEDSEVMLAPTRLPHPTELRQTAVDLLLQAATSTNPLLRANAIEALHHAPEEIEPVLQQGLADENRAVRFVAAMTIGKLKIATLAPLLEPLLLDDSQSVRAAAIYGLHRNNRKVDLNPLARMLLSEDPEAKGNAAFILGELGDASAIPLLRHAAGRGLTRIHAARRKIVDLQIAEAMVKLGASQEIEVIRAALFAPAEQGELVALACQMCGELKDGNAVPNLLDLATRTGARRQSAEVRLAATLAIAQINPNHVPLEVVAEYVDNDRFEIRAQAAYTLGAIGGQKALPHLVKLLNDDNPLVQVAAAGGVVQQDIETGIARVR